MNVDGRSPKRLTRSGMRDEDPVWSPNSKQIAFHSNRDSSRDVEQFEIYRMKADGSEQTRLTNIAGNDRGPDWTFHTLPGLRP